MMETKLTGYHKLRGFFRAYRKGKFLGSFPTPEQAQAAIDESEREADLRFAEAVTRPEGLEWIANRI